jgi:hypothetical protein
VPKFIVVHQYRSDTFGPWEPGAVVELTEEQAAWVEHDSPGCLMPAHEDNTVTDEVKPDTRPADEAPQDRQIKEPPKRRQDRQGDPGDQGAMTKADFKAVKD